MCAAAVAAAAVVYLRRHTISLFSRDSSPYMYNVQFYSKLYLSKVLTRLNILFPIRHKKSFSKLLYKCVVRYIKKDKGKTIYLTLSEVSHIETFDHVSLSK